MPENLKQELQEALAQSRSFFEDLRNLGVTAVPVAELPAELPPCPPDVCGIDRGGSAVCRAETLDEIRADLGDCQRCPLCRGRKQVVFGVGNPHARVVFVGEAPGREEDEQGEPFVGEAGRLLDRILFAMGLAREDVYICNVVKCRPPGNRDPLPEEIAPCEPFLRRQLAAIEPEVIVTLGRFAAQSLLDDQAAISSLRGKWHQYQGIDLLPTYHPAYLLRTPAAKREVWEDMKQVIKRLRESRIG
ncbi:uracil-DNA glycosylase [Trichloromonas sp.]|uniref:uracil-DNA glycosylase n=1 Tax=Trichloromonas sp. TaxID=3069249 RepID=UPI003D8195FD